MLRNAAVPRFTRRSLRRAAGCCRYLPASPPAAARRPAAAFLCVFRIAEKDLGVVAAEAGTDRWRPGRGRCRLRGWGRRRHRWLLRRHFALRSSFGHDFLRGFFRSLLCGFLCRRLHCFLLFAGRCGLFLPGFLLRLRLLRHDRPPDRCCNNGNLIGPIGTGFTPQYRASPRLARGRRRVHRRTRPMLPKCGRTWSTGSPIDQLDRMDRRQLRARGDLSYAANVSCCDHIRSQSLDSPDFALAQPPCDIRLQNIVGSGRATAQMTVRHVLHIEAKTVKQLLWLARYALTMLE